MKLTTKKYKKDLKKYPYRGTISKVANELGTSRQNVIQKYYRHEPEVTELVTAEIERRSNIMKKSTHESVGV